MTLLLDTDVLIELYAGTDQVVDELEKLSDRFPARPAVTFANVAEFAYGFQEKSEDEREQADVFLDSFRYVGSTAATGKRFSEVMYELDREGEPIPQLDVFIAAVAIENGLTVVSMDEYFERIDDLSLVLLDAV